MQHRSEMRNREPMSSRLYSSRSQNGPAPRHLDNLLRRLVATDDRHCPIFATRPSDNGVSVWAARNQSVIADFIKANYSDEIIDRVHAILVREYASSNSGERAFARGRPPGAKNKPKDDTRIYSHGYDVMESLLPKQIEAPKEAPKSVETKQADFSGDYVTRLEFNRFVDARDADSRDIRASIERTASNIRNDIDAISERVDAIKINVPTIVTLNREELPTIELGLQHRNFPQLMIYANTKKRGGDRINTWVYGPKGTGKTTAAENIAKAFFAGKMHYSGIVDEDGLAHYYYNGALASAFQLVGFMDGNGKYVTTPFRKAWEHGGVYLFDEIDGSFPDALLALNGALANSIASFPDRMVKRHKDCIIIAGANTTGLGGTADYVGRMKQDAALTDRFDYLDWPHDDALEDALCANKDWLKIVREVRANCQHTKSKIQVPSMRASIDGEALLVSGLSLSATIDATLRKGVSDNDWNPVKPRYVTIRPIKRQNSPV